MAISHDATDKELAQRSRQGDEEAITLLVERYSPRLHRYLTRLGGDPAMAEDVLQDTWLRVMERIDSYDPGRPFAPWLFAVARNRALDLLRQRTRQGRRVEPVNVDDDFQADPLDLLADGSPSVLDQLAERDLYERVEQTFGALPSELREVLTLRFHEQFRLEDIARVLRLPSSTVKSRLYRALEQLRLRTERYA